MTTMTAATIKDHGGAEHTVPGPFTTIESIKRANEDSGHYWFTPGAMSFFRSRVAPGVIAGRMFVSSEQFEHSSGERHERRYTVRIACDDGTIADASDFQEFDTLRAARHYATRLVQNADVSAS